MWAEAPFATPSVLGPRPARVRWEPIDVRSARLTVPFGEDGRGVLRVEFAPETGLPGATSGMRYRGQEGSRTPWGVQYSGWRTRHRMMVPHRNVAIWGDERRPYGIFEVEGAEYNVDVSPEVASR